MEWMTQEKCYNKKQMEINLLATSCRAEGNHKLYPSVLRLIMLRQC